jgi:hypothetical protein
MDVSQIDCNHMFQSPMYGRNLLKNFQDVMGNPGKRLCCISINFILSIILYEIIKSYILFCMLSAHPCPENVGTEGSMQMKDHEAEKNVIGLDTTL